MTFRFAMSADARSAGQRFRSGLDDEAVPSGARCAVERQVPARFAIIQFARQH